MSVSDSAAASARTFEHSVRATAMRIAPNKRRANSEYISKRVGLVLRTGMKHREFRQVQRRLERNRMASLPVLVGVRDSRSSPTAPICGLIIVGSDGAVSPQERAGLEAVVQQAAARRTPVLALSDASALALRALGHAPAHEAYAGVLIGANIEQLSAGAEIDRAIDLISACPER